MKICLLLLLFLIPLQGHAFEWEDYKKLIIFAGQREYKKLKGKDVSKITLTLNHGDLSGADLNRYDLSGVTFKLCNFEGADLVGTSFRGASLVGCSFKNAFMHFTDFTDADLRFADFRSTKEFTFEYLALLPKGSADFTGANLSSANFMGTRVDGIIFDETTEMRGTLFCQYNHQDYAALPDELCEREEVVLTAEQYKKHISYGF